MEAINGASHRGFSQRMRRVPLRVMAPAYSRASTPTGTEKMMMKSARVPAGAAVLRSRAGTPPPQWAEGVEPAFPAGGRMAASGASGSRETVGEVAPRESPPRFQTRISSKTDVAEAFAERDGAAPWRNPAARMREGAAYCGRGGARAVFAPRPASQTAPFMALFEAAEAARALHPARAASAGLPRRTSQAKLNASVCLDRPVDVDGAILTALTGALSGECPPSANGRAAASAVCLALVDEGVEKREAFHTPALAGDMQAEFPMGNSEFERHLTAQTGGNL